MAQAQRYIADGYNIVVDLDLEKFFDRVNHDSLMARVAARVSDGLPLAYEVLPGNTSDKTTLKGFLERIEAQYGKAERDLSAMRQEWPSFQGYASETRP